MAAIPWVDDAADGFRRVNDQAPLKQRRNDGRLSIFDVFYTLQGEGPFNGTPAIFVRTFGCNLQCPGCDTDYTSKNKEVTPTELFGWVYAVGGRDTSLVVITGGEPFRQDLTEFVQLLAQEGYTIQIETNGTLRCPESILNLAHVVVSPKTAKVSIQSPIAYKYVARAEDLDPEDGLPNRALGLEGKRLARPPADYSGDVFLQPMDEQDPELNRKNTAAVVAACLQHGHRLCLQTHKIVGVP